MLLVSSWSTLCFLEFLASEVFEEGPQRGGLRCSDDLLQMRVVFRDLALDPLEERKRDLWLMNQDAPLVGLVRHPVDETVGNHSVRKLGEGRMIHQHQFR